MNRHIVVLAEERATIESLLKRAVLDKLEDASEESLRIARTERELMLQLDASVSVLLLSSTFTQASHNEFIKKIADSYPTIRIISLNNRYGDRSPIEYGAFDVLDKPVRNPVLWTKMDKAFEEIEKQKADELEVKLPVAETDGYPFSLEVDEEDGEDIEIVSEMPAIETAQLVEEQPETERLRRPAFPAPSVLVFDDEEDEDDEDDLFGDSSPRQSLPPAPLAIYEDEDEEELALPEAPEIPVVEKEDSMEESSIESKEEPTEPSNNVAKETLLPLLEDDEADDEELELPLPLDDEIEDELVLIEEDEHEESIQLPDTPLENVEESPVPSEYVDTQAPPSALSDEDEGFKIPCESLDTKDLTPSQVPLEPSFDELEHENAILTETHSYDEKSEWTKADEGFVAKNGEFVPLAPPRKQIRNLAKGSNASKGEKSNSSSTEGGGLFGSVRSLFKK